MGRNKDAPAIYVCVRIQGLLFNSTRTAGNYASLPELISYIAKSTSEKALVMENKR